MAIQKKSKELLTFRFRHWETIWKLEHSQKKEKNKKMKASVKETSTTKSH